MPNPLKINEQLKKKVGGFPDHSWDGFLIDLGVISPPSWDPEWSQNQYTKGLSKMKTKR